MKVNNIELNIRVLGDKTPFIWAHGLLGSMAFEDSTDWFDWDSFANIAKIVCYDARGHGLSQATYAPEDYHWSNLARDMLALADNLRISTFIAGGKSMGCATSLYAALSAPERVIALVLVNPPTAWERRAAQALNYEKMADIAEARGIPALVNLLQKRETLPDWLVQARPELSQIYLERYSMVEPKALASVLRGAKLCDFPPRDKLKTLKMPALILAWSGDAAHPLATAQELNKLLPNSQLFIARNIEDAKTWSQLIREFIMGLSS